MREVWNRCKVVRFWIVLFLLTATCLEAKPPFCGFYAGVGAGWDSMRVRQKQTNVVTASASAFHYSWGSADGFVGQGYLGWMGNWCVGAFGVRVGYQGFVGLHDRFAVFGVNTMREKKVQGAFLDLTPGYRFRQCWLAYLLFGVGYGQFGQIGEENGPRFFGFFRDSHGWTWMPRAGFGVQRAICGRWTVGFEYLHIFPATLVTYRTRGPTFTDENTRWHRFESDQIALTLNLYH